MAYVGAAAKCLEPFNASLARFRAHTRVWSSLRARAGESPAGCAGLATALFVAALFLVTRPAHAAEIVVGQVGPISGFEATQGRAYSAGMQLHFDALNRTGGINGHTFKLVRRDDAGKPEQTVSLTKQLIAEVKPLVLAGYFGSENIANVVASGVLEQNRIALVGYRVSEIRPEAPFLYNVRASLLDEIVKLVEHAAIVGLSRLGLFYEDGPGSGALTSTAEAAAQKAKVSITVRAPYTANAATVDNAVKSFLQQPPQAILMVSSGAVAASFIEKYRTEGGSALLFAHSGADIEQLSKRLGEEHMRGVVIAQVAPNPYKVSNRVTKDFADALSRKPALDVPVSYAVMEGYIAARVIAEAVRRQGGNPTRPGMAQALDSINDFDLGGYIVGFQPGQRWGSRYVELSIVSNGVRIRQ